MTEAKALFQVEEIIEIKTVRLRVTKMLFFFKANPFSLNPLNKLSESIKEIKLVRLNKTEMCFLKA